MKMKIIDKHFRKLPRKRRAFIIIIGLSYFLVGLIAYLAKLTTSFESFLIFALGLVYSDVLRLSYRIETLEKKKKP